MLLLILAISRAVHNFYDYIAHRYLQVSTSIPGYHPGSVISSVLNLHLELDPSCSLSHIIPLQPLRMTDCTRR